MSIQTESFSDLMYKHTLITVELSRLNSLMVYYSDCGNQPKLAAAVDAMKRLEMSKQILIEQEDLSVAEVAFSCGFSTSQYFSTVFKKHENCTPLEFRQKHMVLNAY